MREFRNVIHHAAICGLLAVAALAQQAQPPLPVPSDSPKPAPESAAQAPTAHTATAAEGKATLYVYRHRRFEGAALKPSVYIDDRELARIENGRYFVAKIEPGKHSIRSNDKASGVEINMKAGTGYFIRVDMQTGFWKGHGRLTMILPEQGEYEVKQTRPANDDDLKDRELVVVNMQLQ
jgi:hypothetical protein